MVEVVSVVDFLLLDFGLDSGLTNMGRMEARLACLLELETLRLEVAAGGRNGQGRAWLRYSILVLQEKKHA